MKLTTEQEIAIKRINEWINDKTGDWMFCLQGYAGTGKTFLLLELIQSLNGIKFHCAAPTGKAASVMMSKMNGIEAITLHRLLYHPVEDDVLALRLLLDQYKTAPTPELLAKIEVEKAALSGNGPSFCNKDNSDIHPGDLVIVDEASMVDSYVLADLKNTGCRALMIGDPGQLPPVGSTSWFIDRKPDAMLETIQRQALDNPIIRFSMEVREGIAKPREWRRAKGCGIYTKEEVDPKDWLGWDQVITGTNFSRHKINRYFRKQLGYAELSQLPVRGEKLICLKNEYGRVPQHINGTQFKCLSAAVYGVTGDPMLDMEYEGHEVNTMFFYDHHCLVHYNKDLKELPREFRKGLMELDYAYAITVHKAQGSEWDNVIIADDRMKAQDYVFRRRWLYTAVTRAKSNLMIIQ